MEKVKTIDFACFEETCDAIIFNAIAEVSPFIESLDLNNLEENRRMARVYLAIENMLDKINVLNRYQYIYYYKDTPSLFKILKSTNRLDCPDEMEKLRQAIIYTEIYNCLMMIKMEMEIRQSAADFFARNDMEQPETSFLFSERMNMFENHDKSRLIKGVSLEDTLTIITLQLNERLGFLKNNSSVKQFVQWILHPNMDKNQPKIHIGCKTNEFKCIMDHFKHFNPDISPTLVGRYGNFISSRGNKITDRNFSNTSYDNLNTRHAIANIFDLFL